MVKVGYYSHGRGWAERIDVGKAKQFVDRYGRDYGLDLAFSEEEAFLELRFSYSIWYVEDDFPEEGQKSRSSGIFRDLRGILTTEPAVLSFVGEDSLHYLMLITPGDADKPYLEIDMVHHPKWEDVPEQYLAVVKRYFER